MDEITRAVRSVRPRAAFPTVDEMLRFARELEAANPGLVSSRQVGASRLGEPIRALTVGDGRHDLAVIGNPHPNEPIGMATITHLAELLCADRELRESLDATWHFIPCADPDATRLNEGWFAGPVTRSDVAAHFYRPPAAEQVEWTFPAEWEGAPLGTPCPETRAVMDLIDRVRPAFVASLHNADIGGGFFYVTGGDGDYFAALTRLVTDAGVRLELGSPDAPGAQVLARAVYRLPAVSELCAAIAAGGTDPRTVLPGGSTQDYVARYGGSVLVSELPLWSDPRSDDESSTGIPLSRVMDASAVRLRELAATMRALLAEADRALTLDTPFRRSVAEHYPQLESVARTKQLMGAAQDRDATVAEAFAEEGLFHDTLKLRLGGMALRMLDAELAAGNSRAEIAAARAGLGAVFEQWCAEVERNTPGVPIPLRDLVGIQAGAIVTAATRVRDGLPV